MDDELLAYYDEIRRLAEAKSDSREEAEDLLSETFLAAFAYRHNGGVIEHPKTYLVHTLMHKRNSLLRRKYRLPKVVSLQTLPEDAADDFTAAEEAYERTEEAAARRISSSASLIRRCGTVPAALRPAAATCISERCRSFCGVCIRASRSTASATRCWSAWTR